MENLSSIIIVLSILGIFLYILLVWALISIIDFSHDFGRFLDLELSKHNNKEDNVSSSIRSQSGSN